MPGFDYRAINITGWTAQTWSDHTLVDKALEYIKAQGGNLAVVDWGVKFADDGSMIPLTSASSITPATADLEYLIDKAHALGLQVFLKPHVANLDGVNRNSANTSLSTFSVDKYFPAWSSYLDSLGDMAKRKGVEGIVFGTENNLLDSDFRPQWASLISSLRSHFSGLLSYDAMFSMYANGKDAGEVVFWDLVDIIGVSLYVPLASSGDPTIAQMEAAWTNNPVGDIGNVYTYLKSLNDKFGKPVMALEGGYQSINGAVTPDRLNEQPNDGQTINNALQADALRVYLSMLERYSGDWFKGVSLWQVTPELMRPSLETSIYNTHEFTFYGKPAADVVKAFFTGAQTYTDTTFHGGWRGDTIDAGPAADTIWAGDGSDVVAAGAGDDLIYQNAIAPGDAPHTVTTISVTLYGGILEGVAPQLSVYVNGVKVGTINVAAVETPREGFGQAATTSQTFTITLPIGVSVDTMKIVHDNDVYKGPGLDRNAIIQAISIDGVALNVADATYYPGFSPAKPGTWVLYEEGYVELGLAPYKAAIALSSRDDDRINGGDGFDTVVYAGAAKDYALAPTTSGWTVMDLRAGSPDGTDTLQNVEALRFTNGTINTADFKAVAGWFSAILRENVTGAHAELATQTALSMTSGQKTATQSLADLIKQADATTSVASMSYQFFTGKVPTEAGVDFLIAPNGPNATNLNSDYYAQFNTVNRYINFAVNLGKNGEAKDSFAASYGGLSLFDATKKAYAAIFGGTPTDAKVHSLIDSRVDYLAAYGGDGATGIGTKAAMVGFLLAAAATENLGVIAKSNDAWLTDLADGAAPFAVNILDPANGYYKADFVFGG
jgi:hypothetical protein